MKKENNQDELERIAVYAEVKAVRREYVMLLRMCNALQLSFIALARSSNITPKEFASFIKDEGANREYEKDVVEEMKIINAPMTEDFAKIAEA